MQNQRLSFSSITAAKYPDSAKDSRHRCPFFETNLSYYSKTRALIPMLPLR
jgi:hypothetical protein